MYPDRNQYVGGWAGGETGLRKWVEVRAFPGHPPSGHSDHPCGSPLPTSACYPHLLCTSQYDSVSVPLQFNSCPAVFYQTHTISA